MAVRFFRFASDVKEGTQSGDPIPEGFAGRRIRNDAVFRLYPALRQQGKFGSACKKGKRFGSGERAGEYFAGDR